MKHLHRTVLAALAVSLTPSCLLAANLGEANNSASHLQDRFEAPDAPPEDDSARLRAITGQGEEARQRFVLRDLRLEGNTVFPTDELKAAWTDMLGHEIGLAEVDEIGRRIQGYYQGKGYGGTRVTRPAQDSSSGKLLLAVQEFHIDTVEVRIDGKTAAAPAAVAPVIEDLRRIGRPKIADATAVMDRLSTLPGVYPLDLRRPVEGESKADLIIELSSVPLDQRADTFRLPDLAAPLPPDQAGRSFRLGDVYVRGTTLLSADALKALWKDKLGQPVTVGELPALAERVAEAYRRQNRPAPHVRFPPQMVIDGIVMMQVEEVAGAPVVLINGKPAPDSVAQQMLERYGATPDEQQLSRLLLDLNDMPGMKVKDARLPALGSGHPEIDMVTRPVSGSISLDNRGAYYAGPWELEGAVAFGNPLGLGDRLEIRGLTIPADVQETRSVRLYYDVPVGHWGTLLNIRYSHTDSQPGSLLAEQGAVILGDKLQMKLLQPLMRSEQQSLWIQAGLGASNPKTMVNNPPGQGAYGDNVLSSEHLRWARGGVTERFTDKLMGFNSSTQFGVDYVNGLTWAGASGWNNAPVASTSGGTPSGFKKVMGDITRITQWGDEWKSTLSVAAQRGFTRLPGSMQFAMGGGTMSPYDDGTVAGESGIGMQIEISKTIPVDLPYLTGYEPYAFYDIAKIWSLEAPSGTADSLASAGVGVRALLWKGFSGSLEVAKPLTTPMLTPGGRYTKDPKVFLAISQAF